MVALPSAKHTGPSTSHPTWLVHASTMPSLPTKWLASASLHESLDTHTAASTLHPTWLVRSLVQVGAPEAGCRQKSEYGGVLWSENISCGSAPSVCMCWLALRQLTIPLANQQGYLWTEPVCPSARPSLHCLSVVNDTLCVRACMLPGARLNKTNRVVGRGRGIPVAVCECARCAHSVLCANTPCQWHLNVAVVQEISSGWASQTPS